MIVTLNTLYINIFYLFFIYSFIIITIPTIPKKNKEYI